MNIVNIDALQHGRNFQGPICPGGILPRLDRIPQSRLQTACSGTKQANTCVQT